MTKVAVDDKHTLFLDGKTDSKVEGDERLATTRIERCEEIDILAVVG